MKSFVLAPKLMKARNYLKLNLRYDKHFQYFLDRFVNFLLSVAVFPFVRIIQISAKLKIKFELLLFNKRCDALNIDFFRNCFFKYFGCCKTLKTFFLIFWRRKMLDTFGFCLRVIKIQCLFL